MYQLLQRPMRFLSLRTIVVVSELAVMLVAVLIGTWAGYAGGVADRVLNTVINLFLTMPSFAVTLIIAGYVKKLDWIAISFIIGLFEWPGGARRIRAQAMSLRGRDFTAALLGSLIYSVLGVVIESALDRLFPKQ